MIPPADLHLAMQNSARPPLAPPVRLHKPADAGDVLAMLRDGSAALAGRLSAWGPHRPDPADVDAARRQVEGLRRLLGELAQ